MPELKNIIPSEAELYAYYREHRSDPAVALRDFEGLEDVEEAAQGLDVTSIFARLIRSSGMASNG